MNKLVLEYKIKVEDVDKKFVQILKNKLNLSTRLLIKLKNKTAIIFKEKALYVNNVITKEDVDYIVYVNLYEVDLEEKEKIDEILENVIDDKIDILYEDIGYICVNKKSNVAIHPCSNHRNNTMLERVQKYMYSKGYKNKIHVVNRLDRETSGVCIFAKHAYYQEIANITDKRYIAVVDGILKKNGVIEKNIARKEGSIMERCIDPNGEYAKTEYKVLEKNIEKNYTIVDVKLYTGRTHQIRVHFQSIGHSLLGDGLYNLKEDYNKYINRVALHSRKIVFNGIDVNANLPEDMKKLMKEG